MKNRYPTILICSLLLALSCPAWAGRKVSQDEKDYRKGLDLYKAGRYEEAITRFRWAIDENWAFWQCYQMVGYCLFELREKDGALDAFEQSLKIHPENAPLWKVYQDLKTGALEVPVRPVEAQFHPAGPPVELQTYYSFNK